MDAQRRLPRSSFEREAAGPQALGRRGRHLENAGQTLFVEPEVVRSPDYRGGQNPGFVDVRHRDRHHTTGFRHLTFSRERIHANLLDGLVASSNPRSSRWRSFVRTRHTVSVRKTRDVRLANSRRLSSHTTRILARPGYPTRSRIPVDVERHPSLVIACPTAEVALEILQQQIRAPSAEQIYRVDFFDPSAAAPTAAADFVSKGIETHPAMVEGAMTRARQNGRSSSSGAAAEPRSDAQGTSSSASAREVSGV